MPEPTCVVRLHGDLPATGGRLGPDPEHFLVEEIPAYEPCGDGPHWMVCVQKRMLTTPDLVRFLARASGARPRDVGVAGMKDRVAVTSQWVTLPVQGTRAPETWQLGEGMEVLSVSRHTNKLRTGHLRGNRFALTLVDCDLEAAARALPDAAGQGPEGLLGAWTSRLAERGFANGFGPQRFGRGGSNLAAAIDWLAAGAPAGRMPRSRRKLLASVLQSELFNRYLAARVALGLDRLLVGEVVRLAGAGAHFVVEDVEAETKRLREADVVPTGPMFGPKMMTAAGEAAELEAATLAGLGITAEDLDALARWAPGTRRDLLTWPAELAIEVASSPSKVADATSRPSLIVRMRLEPGGYATVALAELTGADPRAPRAAGQAPADALITS